MSLSTTRRGRPCTVCRHARRREIDEQLAQGASTTAVTAQFRGISDDAVQRHRARHLPATLARAEGAREMMRGNTLLAQVRAISERAGAILDRAERAGDLRVALVAVREVRGGLELLAKLSGELRGERAAAPPPPVPTESAKVLILLPENGREVGQTPVSLVDVLREYTLYPARCDGHPDEAPGTCDVQRATHRGG